MAHSDGKQEANAGMIKNEIFVDQNFFSSSEMVKVQHEIR
jgi:hypothetical protein